MKSIAWILRSELGEWPVENVHISEIGAPGRQAGRIEWGCGVSGTGELTIIRSCVSN